MNALTSQMATIPEVEDLSFRQAYALLKARGFENVEIEYVPGDFKDLAVSVDLRGRALAKGEHVPLTAPLVLKVSSGEGRDASRLFVDRLPCRRCPSNHWIVKKKTGFSYG